jgi:hypothetical protein
MPNGEQPEVQHRLRTLNPRLEEWSAVPASTGHAGELVVPFQEKRRLETTLRGGLLSSLAKSIRG